MKTINKFLQEANERYTIYCDLDGVLTDWEKAVRKLGFGSSESLIERGGEGLLFGLIGKAGVKFWSQMDWMPDGKKLWNYISQYPVKIISAPTKNPTSIRGKNIWIDIELGRDIERIIVPSKEKKKFSSPQGILIDDRENNVTDWRLAGGIAIHHIDTDTTIKKLKVIL